jgi:hypothetical protein
MNAQAMFRASSRSTSCLWNALKAFRFFYFALSGGGWCRTNDEVNAQDEPTAPQAIKNTNVKSDDEQTVKITTRLPIG